MTLPSRQTLVDVLSATFLAGALAYAGGVARASADTAATVTVSQKGREFRPGSMEVKAGTVVRIVNDDDNVRHHAYVDDSGMAFDSGDQDVGDHADVTFAERGTFAVLCAIHPKMRLDVAVR